MGTVRSKVTEGTSTLFLLLGQVTTDRVVEAFKAAPKFEVIASNLSPGPLVAVTMHRVASCTKVATLSFWLTQTVVPVSGVSKRLGGHIVFQSGHPCALSQSM